MVTKSTHKQIIKLIKEYIKIKENSKTFVVKFFILTNYNKIIHHLKENLMNISKI